MLFCRIKILCRIKVSEPAATTIAVQNDAVGARQSIGENRQVELV